MNSESSIRIYLIKFQGQVKQYNLTPNNDDFQSEIEASAKFWEKATMVNIITRKLKQ